jgi:hypothetical protein
MYAPNWSLLQLSIHFQTETSSKIIYSFSHKKNPEEGNHEIPFSKAKVRDKRCTMIVATLALQKAY